ncbi:MAG: hypothetical protein LBU58_04465, partial [Clostridiales bacterium]|nr:hypothetical protein [Clostridiales bacterium]
MKIRKYTAGNAQEAIAKVKSDLGTEALIISTKKVRQKGLLGLFRKPMTEVMAAIDEQAQAKAKRLASQVRGEAAAPGDVFAQFQSQLREANRAATAAPNLGALTSQVQAYQAQTQPAQLSAQAQTPQTPQTLQTPQTQRAQEHTSEPARGRQDQAQAGLARPAGGRAQQEAAPPPDRLSELESKVTQMEGLLTKVYQEVSSTSK